MNDRIEDTEVTVVSIPAILELGLCVHSDWAVSSWAVASAIFRSLPGVLKEDVAASNNSRFSSNGERV